MLSYENDLCELQLYFKEAVWISALTGDPDLLHIRFRPFSDSIIRSKENGSYLGPNKQIFRVIGP